VTAGWGGTFPGSFGSLLVFQVPMGRTRIACGGPGAARVMDGLCHWAAPARITGILGPCLAGPQGQGVLVEGEKPCHPQVGHPQQV
jgi:hypothetical protein